MIDNRANTTKYAIYFGILYFFMTYILRIISALLLVLLDIDIDSVIDTAAVLTSLMGTIDKFLKDNNRAPSKTEKWKLIWLSLLFYWIVFLIQHSIYHFFSDNPIDIFEKDNFIFAIVVFIALSMIYGLVFYYFYGSSAKKQLKRLQEKNKL
jgi:hypothetical protein